MDNTNATPEGIGYLHVEAPITPGYLAVKTFYSKLLRTTVIDERDLIAASGHKPSDFKGDKIEKHYDSGTWTFHASH